MLLLVPLLLSVLPLLLLLLLLLLAVLLRLSTRWMGEYCCGDARPFVGDAAVPAECSWAACTARRTDPAGERAAAPLVVREGEVAPPAEAVLESDLDEADEAVL